MKFLWKFWEKIHVKSRCHFVETFKTPKFLPNWGWVSLWIGVSLASELAFFLQPLNFLLIYVIQPSGRWSVYIIAGDPVLCWPSLESSAHVNFFIISIILRFNEICIHLVSEGQAPPTASSILGSQYLHWDLRNLRLLQHPLSSS